MTSVGFTYISPLGIYSQKVKATKDLPQGARVAIPNDPSNENRALLLAAQGVIAEAGCRHQRQQRHAAGSRREPQEAEAGRA